MLRNCCDNRPESSARYHQPVSTSRKHLIWRFFVSCLCLLVLAVVEQVHAQTEVAKLVGSDSVDLDQFGQELAIDADWAIVGVPSSNPGGLDGAGSAYIFSKDHGGPDAWGEVRKILADLPAILDRFGRSVGISGDIVIVGASGRDDNGQDSGAAYIFERDLGGPNNWGLRTKLLASDGEAFDKYGASVAMDGDIVIVGAPVGGADDAENSGSAYVYYRNQGGTDNWGLVIEITADDAKTNHNFTAVAICGETLVVGVDFAGPISGAIYIFERNEGGPDNWGQVKKRFASDSTANDLFGSHVDVNGDIAIVGAHNHGSPINGAGAAYIFQRNHGGLNNWGEVKKLTASDAQESDFFGRDVMVSGNAALAGATHEDAAGLSAGAAYLFHQNQGGADSWGEVVKFTATDTESPDRFGDGQAISGDRVMICAINDGGNFLGAAYVFEGVLCPADFDGSCAVDVKDLLFLLGAWGPCDEPCPPFCPADFDGSCAVDVKDLLFLLGAWGPCPCAPHAEVLSLDDVLTNACVSHENWDDFLEVIETGSEAEKENWLCWMNHHLNNCTSCFCPHSPEICPGPDPF